MYHRVAHVTTRARMAPDDEVLVGLSFGPLRPLSFSRHRGVARPRRAKPISDVG